MDEDRLPSISADVSEARLMKDLEALAQWVKLSGTADELKSFEYVRSVLDGIGYRTTLLSHDAYISLPGAARIEVDGKVLNCITHSHSLPSPPGGTTGELVYVGEGKEADLGKRDLTGCILLMEGMARPGTARFGALAGAAGQIHITPDHMLHEMCVSPVWGSPSQESRGEMPTTVMATISREDGAMLRERLERGEKPKIVIHAEVDTGWRKTPILVADMEAPGAGADAPFVMFSGHIDTWYYGVMDNGAANGTIIEVARLAAEHRDRWRRGLRLCFWSGHSHGRYSGSTWYADAYWQELDQNCVVHVNVDSTGGKDAVVLTNSGSAAELRPLASEAIRQHAGQQYAGKPLARQGDESFWGVGIPAMFGSLSHQAPPPGHQGAHMHLGWWWHTPEDTIDKIDPANLVRDTKIFAHLIWRFLTDPVAPLDYTVHAEDLLAELGKLKALDGQFDLEPIATEAGRLKDRAREVARRAAATSDEAEHRRIDRALMRVSRALVPIHSTKGDRFDHDPALPQPVWPTLRPVRDLAQMAPGSDDWPFQMVSAMRARNRVVHALRSANAALDDVLGEPGR